MPFKRRPLPLWAQLALPMSTVLLIAILGGIVVYESYWDRVLQKVSPQVREAIENVRPSPKLVLQDSRLRPGPGLISLVFSALVLIAVSVMISRRILKPIEALERSVNAISKQGLHEPIQVPRGQFADLLQGVAEIAEKLERSESARRIANAAIAHELRTPLTALRARVESLEFGVYPLEISEVTKLHSSLDLLEKLIWDLQTVSLSEANELHLDIQNLDVGALLLEVRDDLQFLADQKNISLHSEAEVNIVIQADPGRIRQVIHNLLENAIRYTPAGERIEAITQTTDQFLKISIADSGKGVPDSELEQLFTPFYRLEPSRSREFGGSGLGLAVVAAIVNAHHGTIKAHKADIGGLEMVILLPLNANNPSPEVSRAARV
jgi:two-component system, OmpR family, sensor histidine kinase BaeS